MSNPKIYTATEITANDSDGAHTVLEEIHVLSPGHWKTKGHGEITVNESDIDEYIKNFDELYGGGRYDLPIDREHKRLEGAAGWMKGLFKRNGELWASVSWNPSAKEELADGKYRYFSPEFWPTGWVNPLDKSDVRKNVLVGGGITNRPLFKGVLGAVAASEDGNQLIFIQGGEQSMFDIDGLRKKNAEDLTEEERTFLGERKDQLTEDELAKFGLVEVEAAPADEAKPEAPADEAESDDVQEEDKPTEQPQEEAPAVAPAEPVQASAVTGITVEELEELRVLASEAKQAREEAIQAKEELRRDRTSQAIQAHVVEGKIKSGDANSWVDVLMASDEQQRSQIETLLAGLPKNENIGKELGDAGQDAKVEASTEVHNRVVKVQADARAAGKTVSYAQARKEVLASGFHAD